MYIESLVWLYSAPLLAVMADHFIHRKLVININFHWRRWGSSLPGLRMLDPPLSPPSTPAEFFWHDDIMTAWDVGLRIVYVLVVT